MQLQRRDRFPVRVSATVAVDDRDPVPCVMLNISQDGCRIETDQTLPIGSMVIIHEPRLGTLRGTVRWSLLGSSGCRFSD
ncbi:PilZ domain-containing protein [Sphingomonas ginkgonis]|uniref:PilZ domain-containing protein n=1 Tax=Sphingomonas ginkgonis TaxID=2315330 RepID=UPI0023B2CF71|nr:PilZ domain-containing protein [Sphingomonas ginkgonis]